MAPGATVIRYGIGVDNIDVDAARQLGVRVSNVPDYGVDTVADHATTLILGALRKVGTFDRAVRAQRKWVEPASLGEITEFASSSVGLIGTGRVGCAVAARLAPFGFTVIASDPFADRERTDAVGVRLTNLQEVLANCDAVSLHAPLTPETRGIIDASALASMRPTAVLINTARGPLVNSDALAAALVAGHIAGAALDVVDPEPLPADSPLWDAPNLTITPHVSFYSTASMARLERLAAEEAARAIRGQPLRSQVV
jgi:D-3-phosphoglycerate dehydrogenase / 2-oxoglutarate reductase